MPARTPEEIRAAIEENRAELAKSIEKLRDEVTELTDWRAQLRRNLEVLTIGAAAGGFVLGGGIGGTAALLFGRRGRRERRAERRRLEAAKRGG